MSPESGSIPPQDPKPGNRLAFRALNYAHEVGKGLMERNILLDTTVDNRDNLHDLMIWVDESVEGSGDSLKLTSEGERHLSKYEKTFTSLQEVVESYTVLADWNELNDVTWEELTEKERFLLGEVRKRISVELSSRVEMDVLERDEANIRQGKKASLKYGKNEVKDIKAGKLIPSSKVGDSRGIVAALVKESWSNPNVPDLQRTSDETFEEFKERVYLHYALNNAPTSELNRIQPPQEPVREKIWTWQRQAIAGLFVTAAIVWGAVAVDKQQKYLDQVYQHIFTQVEGNAARAIESTLPPLSPASSRRVIVEVAPNALQDGTVALDAFGENLRVQITNQLTDTNILSGTDVLNGQVNGSSTDKAKIDVDAQGNITAGKITQGDTTYILEPVQGQGPNVLSVEEQTGEQKQEAQPPVEIDAVAPTVAGAPSIQSADAVDTSYNPELGVTNDRIIQWAVMASDRIRSKFPGYVGSFNIASAEINDAFVRDGINARVQSLGSVDKPASVVFDEKTQGLQQIREAVQANQEIQQLRRNKGLDIVVVYVDDSSSCGNSPIMIKGFDNPDAMRPYGILVVSKSCAETFHSLMHELGHILGLDHQAINKSVMDDILLNLWGRGRVKNGHGDAETYPENGSIRDGDFSNANKPVGPNPGEAGTYDQAAVIEHTITVISDLMKAVAQPQNNSIYHDFLPYVVR